ncbi:MAG: NAD-binding protein [Thomasclavelia sp.]|jgi:trk system potassium uptake protein TrkA|nr:NAD-binding protein [Thomasclavelia sp.]
MMDSKKHGYSIIVGCGGLGSFLATHFSEEGKDVMVIDLEGSAFRKLSKSYGGITMAANATDIEKLKKAKMNEADNVIVVTNNDNVNIFVAQIAKKMFNVPYVVARIYDECKSVLVEKYNIETICPTILSEQEVLVDVKDGSVH